MPAPFLKFHLLPDGYKEATDSDVQSRLSDELLPLQDKEIILANAQLLTGVGEVVNLPCIPVDPAAVRVVENMSPVNGLLQNVTVPTTQIVNIPDSGGTYSMFVLRSDNSIVPNDQYTVTASGVAFAAQPSGALRLSYYPRASTPATRWALPYQKPYVGTNTSFDRISLVVDDAPPIRGTAAGTNREYVTTAAATTVKASYWYEAPIGKTFIGSHPNWLVEHMNTWPDVFVGTKDYPGDSGNFNGTPITQGPVPQYREPGTYTPSWRDGLISFDEIINSSITPVRANYAYLAGTQNVTGQKLTATDGTNKSFRATAEVIFPETHGKRLVTRSNLNMPFNVYVNGQIVPKRMNVTPFEVLTIKTAP